MGCYVNPPMDKVQWLKANGLEITRNEALEHNDYNDVMLVVTMDNGPFVAAGIAISPAEKKYIMNTVGDPRPRAYFLVEVSKLMKVSHELPIYRKDLFF